MARKNTRSRAKADAKDTPLFAFKHIGEGNDTNNNTLPRVSSFRRLEKQTARVFLWKL